ncbi:hypothetical protein DFJ74DRAFT_768400 [Hyaloraphidium curvatum]|nr:hypothetical protein DFJ74DRAFT_768400 [Hyaloraphidium curvatum]
MPVSSLRLLRRGPAFGGRAFRCGAYELLVCVAEGTAAGQPFAVDVVLLRPADSAAAQTLFFEVTNRGNPLSLFLFCDAPRHASFADLTRPEGAGNGFLFDLGLAVAWTGWLGTIPCWGTSDAAMNVRDAFPVLLGTSFPMLEGVQGRVTEEAVFDPPFAPRAVIPLAYKLNRTSPDFRMTVRESPSDPEVQVPQDLFAPSRPGKSAVLKLDVSKPFELGGRTFHPSACIFTLTYTAADPPAMALGFDATRDVLSHLKRAALSPDLLPNHTPLPCAAFGYSQSGRFLRSLLHECGNLDPSSAGDAPASRRLIDLCHPFVAGARLLSLSSPFPFPGRFPRAYEDHSFVLPSAGRPHAYLPSSAGPGILSRCLDEGTAPLLVHADSSNEFWQGWSSLLGPPPAADAGVRMVLLPACPHSPAPDSPRRLEPFAHGVNRLDYRPALRAVLAASLGWLAGGRPPPSAWPSALAPASSLPALHPDLPFPEASNAPHPSLPTMVPLPGGPAAAEDGWPLAQLAVPLGKYAGWNVRVLPGGRRVLGSIHGSFLPFSVEEAARMYPGGRDEFVRRTGEWVRGAVEGGWLLEGDTEGMVKAQGKLWDAVVGGRARFPPGGPSGASASRSDDLVEVVFVQDRAPSFRYLRGSLVARAPGSVFTHHFGPDGVNAGKSSLPDTYTVDRDRDTFRRFDAAFYGLPDEEFRLPEPGPPWAEFDLPGVRFVTWAEAAEIVAGLEWKDNRAVLPCKFAIVTKSDYLFSYRVRFQDDEDAAEVPWDAKPVPAYINDLVWTAIVKGATFPEIEIGPNAIVPDKNLVLGYVTAVMRQPFVFFDIRTMVDDEDGHSQCFVEAIYPDHHTMRSASTTKMTPLLTKLGNPMEKPAGVEG